MQKKILFFLSFIFLSTLTVQGNTDALEQAIFIDDGISLEELVKIENEIVMHQPPGLSCNQQLELVKFVFTHPSFTLDYLKSQSHQAPEKLDTYFSRHKKACVITVTSGIFLILLAFGLKIITENRVTTKS